MSDRVLRMSNLATERFGLDVEVNNPFCKDIQRIVNDLFNRLADENEFSNNAFEELISCLRSYKPIPDRYVKWFQKYSFAVVKRSVGQNQLEILEKIIEVFELECTR